MPRCKACGAKIVWIKTIAGKSMPCDANPVLYWESSRAKGKIVTPNGEVLSCDLVGDIIKATGMGYVPHWASCPKADAFKRPAPLKRPGGKRPYG